MDHHSGAAGAQPQGVLENRDGTRELPILIAGAGIGGLATALALARRGVSSHVFERRQSFPPEGAGIQIGPNGGHVLASLGLSDKLRANAGVPQAIRVHAGRSGRVLNRLPLGARISERFGAPYWVAHRADLHAALLDAAETSELITLSQDAGVIRAEQDPSSVQIETQNGLHIEGAALVAADGVWSDLRKQVFGAAEPRYSGRSAARAMLPVEAVPSGIATQDVGVWLAPGAHVVHYPVRGGRELALVVVYHAPEPERGWSGEVPATRVRDRVSGFAPVLQELIAAVPAWRQWGLYDLTVQLPLAKSRVALLGDAAHPILPFLAQGGVMALEDGATLAEAISSHEDIPAALTAYAAARTERVTRVQKASRRNGDIYHLGGALGLARDITLRSLSGALLMAQYDWLYGWRPEKI